MSGGRVWLGVAFGDLTRAHMGGLAEAVDGLDAALAARGVPTDVRGERLRLLGILAIHAAPSPRFVDTLVALMEAP